MAWYVGSGPCFSEASVLVPRGGLRLHAQGYRRVALTKTTTTTTNSYHYLSCYCLYTEQTLRKTRRPCRQGPQGFVEVRRVD